MFITQYCCEEFCSTELTEDRKSAFGSWVLTVRTKVYEKGRLYRNRKEKYIGFERGWLSVLRREHDGYAVHDAGFRGPRERDKGRELVRKREIGQGVLAFGKKGSESWKGRAVLNRKKRAR